MNQLAAADVRVLFERLKSTFPIPRYLEGEGEVHAFVGAELVKLKPERGRLIDIGCGALDKTALFAMLGFECYGCDDFMDPWHRRPGVQEKIRGLAESHGIRLHVFENGDTTIPFERGSFEVVTIMEVVEHLHESPRNILNAAGEMLREDGILVIVMPNSVNIRKRLDVVRGRTNYADIGGYFHSSGTWRGHVREYTLDETAYIAREMGFEVVRAVTFDGMVERRIGNAFARMLYRSFMRLAPGMRDSVFVAARKPAGWKPRQPSDEAYREAIARAVPAGVR